MREILFRDAHYRHSDNKFDHFSYWGTIDHNGNHNEGVFTYPSSTNFTYVKTREQFTGLCDKNGNKIFEGDIVKWIVILDGKIISEYFYEVVYLELGKMDYPGFHFLEIKTREWIHGSSRRFEIIGNIHDNPEPLNTKK